MLQFLLDLMQQPAIIIGLVAMVGLIVQKKRFGAVFSGTIKTALGLLIISAGAGLIVTYILPFVNLFTSVFHLSGFATSSEGVSGAMQKAVPVIASSSALIMGIGFLVNIALARLTPLKYIFLTGHMMWILSVAVAFVLYAANLNYTMILVIGSILQGMLMVIFPAITQSSVRKVTGSDDFAIAHLTTLGTVPAGIIGGWLGDKSKDAEDMKLPKELEFFKDTATSITIVMGIFYMVLVLIAGPGQVAQYANGQNYIIFGLLQALGFVAGVLVLLQGVRMFLGDLIPAFKGISDKIVPNAIPALDVPAIFAYAPNSLMLGFITAVIGMIVAMFVDMLVFGTVPLVSIIGAFFTGGVAGIFGNARGGRRGAMIAGFVYGFLLIFGTAVVSVLYDFAAFGSKGVGHDCLDAMGILTIFKIPVIGIIVVVAVFIVLAISQVRRNRRIAPDKGAAI
jgi:ascorbate PTS system EIIC component